MSGLFRNSRLYVLISSVLLSLLFALYSYFYIPVGILQNIRFEQLCGLASIMYLYISLLIGPFFYQFPRVSGGEIWKHMRRAIGVSSCYFAILHTYVTFFEQLKGFSGIAYLSNSYVIALLLGCISLSILVILTLTSVDLAVRTLGFTNWKLLHRLTYVGGVFVLIHVLMLGTHFTDVSGIPSEVLFLAVSFLLFLNAKRMDFFLKESYGFGIQLGLITSITLGSLLFVLLFVINPMYSVQNGHVSFGIHSAHIRLAQEAQSQNPQSSSTIPGLDGDRSLRYTVSLSKPDQINPNEDTVLVFSVFNAATGNPVGAFKTVYTKIAHLVIVDSSLRYFSHVHPTQQDNGFTITTQFPHSGIYHMYLDFQPYGGIEQQIGFTISVTGDEQLVSAKEDTAQTKEVGPYTIAINTHGKLSARLMSVGQQTISFTLTDTKTKKSVTNITPYLGALGHLVMIRKEDYSYMHVHPSNLTILPETATGGPVVDFLPIGIYGPFTAGTYRVFAQFNPDGTLILADFTVKVDK